MLSKGRLPPSTPLYLIPALSLYGLFVLWPLLRVLWLSLQRWNGYGPQIFRGPGNFADLWNDSLFRTSLAHSVEWEIAAMLAPTAAALGIGLALRRSRLRGPVTAVLLFPALIPATVVAAIWVLVYSPASGPLAAVLSTAGLSSLNRAWLGDPHLALPALFVAWLWSSIGVGTLLFSIALRRVGREYVEVALVEGAGPFPLMRHVFLPALLATGGVVLVINAALAAQVFDLVYVTTGGGPGYATMILPVDMYGRAFGGGQAGQGAAVAVVQMALGLTPALVAMLLLRRRYGGEWETGEAPDSERGGHAIAVGAGVLAGAAVAIPLVWIAAVACGGVQLSPGLPAATLDPRTWQWSNFAAAWNAGMSDAFVTSALLAVGVVLITAVIAIPAAFALARMVRSRGLKLAAGALLILGLFQPTPVVIIPLFWLLKDLGLLNSPAGIVLPEAARTLPFAILVLWTFIGGLPAHVFEGAAVDGAGALQQLLRIAIPLMQPALAIVAIWSFATSWNEYLIPTLVSTDGSMQTVPVLLATFVGRADTEYGLLAAGTLLAILPGLLAYSVLLRPAAQGLGRLGRTSVQ